MNDEMIKPKIPYSEVDDQEGEEIELAAEEEDEELNPTFPPSEEEVDTANAAFFSEPPQDESENIQEEEIHSGLQSDDEEWEQELSGERPDNGYLPGQRIAEHGIEHENFPRNP